MGGIDERKMQDFLAKQAAEQRQRSLKRGLSTEQDGSQDVKDAQEAVANIRKMAADWKAITEKTEGEYEAQLAAAKKQKCMRLLICLESLCCGKKVKKKKK